jgi:hypothetical protein
MRNCGLVIRLRETAAFFQLMAFSSWRISMLRRDSNMVGSLQLTARANQQLQQQIRSPAVANSLTLPIAVLVFASSSVSFAISVRKSSLLMA